MPFLSAFSTMLYTVASQQQKLVYDIIRKHNRETKLNIGSVSDIKKEPFIPSITEGFDDGRE